MFNGYHVSCPGVQRPGREVVHSPPSSAEVKMSGDLPLRSPKCPHGVDREEFTFTQDAVLIMLLKWSLYHVLYFKKQTVNCEHMAQFGCSVPSLSDRPEPVLVECSLPGSCPPTTLSSARWIQLTPSHITCLTFYFVLSSPVHLRVFHFSRHVAWVDHLILLVQIIFFFFEEGWKLQITVLFNLLLYPPS